MYKPNWTKNGTTYRKSRYFTFNAASHKPGPMAAANAISVNSGRAIIRQSGTNRYHTSSRARKPPAIKKSTRLVITALAGTTRRGKYIFDTRFELTIRLLLLSDSELEKNCQGNSPQKTSIG